MTHTYLSAQQQNNTASKKSSTRLNTKGKNQGGYTRRRSARKVGESNHTKHARSIFFAVSEDGEYKEPHDGRFFSVNALAEYLDCCHATAKRIYKQFEERGELIRISAYAEAGRQKRNRTYILKKSLPKELFDFLKNGHFVLSKKYEILHFRSADLSTKSGKNILEMLAPYRAKKAKRGENAPPTVKALNNTYITSKFFTPKGECEGDIHNPLAGFVGGEDLRETSHHNLAPKTPRVKPAPTPCKLNPTPKAPQNKQKGTAFKTSKRNKTTTAGKHTKSKGGTCKTCAIKPKVNPKQRAGIAKALSIYQRTFGAISQAMAHKFEREFLKSGWDIETPIKRMEYLCSEILLLQTTKSPMRVFHYDKLIPCVNFTRDRFLKHIRWAKQTQEGRIGRDKCANDPAIRRFYGENISDDGIYSNVIEVWATL